MKIIVNENENGEGFLQFGADSETDEFLIKAYEKILIEGNLNLVFGVEDDKLVIYVQPDNIDLGYN